MAIAFNKQKGSAIKEGANAYKYENGDNKVRIVGDILARYVYWVNAGASNIPFECLSFDRDQEKFTNIETDWVKEMYPELKCGWSYVTQCIDPKDGTVKVLNLKKKLWEQIITAAEDLGDPTDPDTGWDICFKRVKTGPLPYNVEYQLQALKCKNRALTPEEVEACKDLRSMDLVMPKPSAESQKKRLDGMRPAASPESNTDDDIEKEFDVT